MPFHYELSALLTLTTQKNIHINVSANWRWHRARFCYTTATHCWCNRPLLYDSLHKLHIQVFHSAKRIHLALDTTTSPSFFDYLFNLKTHSHQCTNGKKRWKSPPKEGRLANVFGRLPTLVDNSEHACSSSSISGILNFVALPRPK